MTAFTIDLSPVIRMTDEQFYQLCQANPEIKFERSAQGELIIMAPTGGETGNWLLNRQDQQVEIYGSG